MTNEDSSANYQKTKGGGSKKFYPPCRHCEKKGHPPYKCWRRPDAFCSKCNQLGHEAVICKVKGQVEEVDAQLADQEEGQLFVVTCSLGKKSSKSCYCAALECSSTLIGNQWKPARRNEYKNTQ